MTPAFVTVTAVPIRAVSRVSSRQHRPVFSCRRNLSVSVAMTLISPSEAHARKSNGWKHLDVRTEGEFSTIRATNSVNVPFMNRNANGMTPNPSFLATVDEKFEKTDNIVISCASGVRSARAYAALTAAGYSNLADMEGGMNSYSSDSSLPKE